MVMVVYKREHIDGYNNIHAILLFSMYVDSVKDIYNLSHYYDSTGSMKFKSLYRIGCGRKWYLMSTVSHSV